LSPQEGTGRLAVHVLKRRGGTLARPVLVDLDARSFVTAHKTTRPRPLPAFPPAAGPPQGRRAPRGEASEASFGGITIREAVRATPPRRARRAAS
jgi:hypothetical protein